jgi:hypothetical protein
MRLPRPHQGRAADTKWAGGASADRWPQPPLCLTQAASNARRMSGPAFSRSAADEIRTSTSPVP